MVLVNHGELPFEVQVGDRIAQLIVELIDVPVVQEVASLDATNREQWVWKHGDALRGFAREHNRGRALKVT